MNLDEAQKQVTEMVIKELKAFDETGKKPFWAQPWESQTTVAMPKKPDGQLYQGINLMVLLNQHLEKSYSKPTWGTFNFWSKNKRKIIKGSKGTRVFYSTPWEVEKKDKNGEIEKDEEGNKVMMNIFIRKQYTVFNEDQTIGDDFSPPEIDQKYDVHVPEALEVYHVGNQACYFPKTDVVKMPPKEHFKDEQRYTARLLHELIHATGHSSRLNRNLQNNLGSEDYAKEELVAELGSMFLRCKAKVDALTLQHSTNYISSWIKILNNDHQFIFSAASKAQKAANYLLKPSN